MRKNNISHRIHPLSSKHKFLSQTIENNNNLRKIKINLYRTKSDNNIHFLQIKKIISKENKERKKRNEIYNKKIYSNETIGFLNEETQEIKYIKKYKEDELSFVKSKIIPEIKWQNFDTDALTSEEQKVNAIKKEMNWLGDTINRIKNNDKFFKFNVSMYKLSQKYPNNNLEVRI